MAGSQRAKKRGPGKPFQKGEDPRRNPGDMSAVARSWAAMLRNRVADRLSPEDAADVLVEAYRKKWPWAIREVHGLLVPELPKSVEHTGEVMTGGKLTIEVVQVRSK